MVADALSWITTCLGSEAVQSILDGVTLGMAHRAECHRPSVVEGDQNLEKEVHVAAGQVQVEMHMTNRAAAQKEDPDLNAMLNWLGAQKKSDLRTLLPVKSAKWCGGIVRVSQLSRMPSIYALCPKGRMRIYYSSSSWRHIELPLWMGVIEMQDTKAMTILCP